jgi:hypothetical protein
MMQRWTYSQYKVAVKSDIDYALTKHGYLPTQAIGYAHNELALRLDEHPEEATLALVALGSEANALQVLDAYPADDAFIEEILQHLQPSLVANIGGSLSYSEQTAFVEDAERLAQSLSSRKPGT